jgi:hypothetical protein
MMTWIEQRWFIFCIYDVYFQDFSVFQYNKAISVMASCVEIMGAIYRSESGLMFCKLLKNVATNMDNVVFSIQIHLKLA